MATVRTRASALVKSPIFSQFTFDNAKTALFFYVLLTNTLKAHRHLRARGIVTSARELYTWIAQVRFNVMEGNSSFNCGQWLANNLSLPSRSRYAKESGSSDEPGQARH